MKDTAQDNASGKVFNLNSQPELGSPIEAIYQCQCVCGRIVYIRESLLLNGTARGCLDCTGFEDDVICPDCGNKASKNTNYFII